MTDESSEPQRNQYSKMEDDGDHEEEQLQDDSPTTSTHDTSERGGGGGGLTGFANFVAGFAGNKDTTNEDSNARPGSTTSSEQSQETSSTHGSSAATEPSNQSAASGFSGILSLTKKNKKPTLPKIQSSGIVNYGIKMDSDSESDASSVSVQSVSQGYDLPFSMMPAYNNDVRDVRDDDDDDNISVRTPMPTGPSESGGILPSAFLRDRVKSTGNISDISEEEESSVVKRKKREEENVGRLVQAAKQQQSFAQAWFTAGKSETLNALPKFVPPPLKKKISFKEPEKASGPIDLDSGEEWEGDDEKTKKKNTSWEAGSFNFTTHSGVTKKRKNKGFGVSDVPDDEDLTTYYQENKCGDRIVCTIGSTRCSLLALIILFGGLAAIIVGGTVASVYVTRSTGGVEESSRPSLSPSPTTTSVPSMYPTNSPSLLPSISPTSIPTSSPTTRPSNRPSSSPTLRPTSRPSVSPTTRPTLSPSSTPTLRPSPSPTLSQQPSPSPSSAPTTFFSATSFTQVGSDVGINAALNDRFGQSVSMSKDGNIIAVGALTYPDNKGSISVYDKVNGQWQPKGGLIVGLEEASQAGHCVELSEDGLTLILGEYLRRSTTDANLIVGAARVFRFIDGAWVRLGQILEGSSQNAQFGFSVAISRDGNRVAVGAKLHDFRSGRVRVYNLDQSSVWQAIGSPLNGGALAEFGHDISLSANGDILACGAPGGKAPASTSLVSSGYVTVFKLNESDINNPTWDRYGDVLEYATSASFFPPPRFGESVSSSDDGTRIAIGTIYDGVQNNFQSGSVSVFEYNSSSSSFDKMGNDMIGKPAFTQQFGQRISMSPNGMHVAVGVPNADAFKGNVFVYRYNGHLWDLAEIIKGNVSNELFGKDVAIAANMDVDKGEEFPTYVVAGGPLVFGRGIARVFEWQQ